MEFNYYLRRSPTLSASAARSKGEAQRRINSATKKGMRGFAIPQDAERMPPLRQRTERSSISPSPAIGLVGMLSSASIGSLVIHTNLNTVSKENFPSQHAARTTDAIIKVADRDAAARRGLGADGMRSEPAGSSKLPLPLLDPSFGINSIDIDVLQVRGPSDGCGRRGP